MKSVLLSIRPKWCELIANRKKTVEVRKTKPKLQTPFKCLIYCTKGKTVKEKTITGNKYEMFYKGSGKLIGEFICDKIYDISFEKITAEETPLDRDILNESCLTLTELTDYCKCGYGWHISELVIYDTPKELSDFGLKRPPQSWCYVEEYKNEVYGLDGTVYTPNEDRTCWVGKPKEREHNDP